MSNIWKWPLLTSCAVACAFLIVDVGFFSANLLKIADGGWLPLTFGVVVFLIMLTWRWGIDALRASLAKASLAPDKFIADLDAGKIPRVDGTAVFLTRTEQNIPPLLIDHVRHMGALHRRVIALTVVFEESPRVPDAERGTVQQIADGIWHADVHFGFVEIPDILKALNALRGWGVAIDFDHAIYFGSRDIVVGSGKQGLLAQARLSLFGFLYRNAVKAVDRFSLPPPNVVEIAREVEI